MFERVLLPKSKKVPPEVFYKKGVFKFLKIYKELPVSERL